MISPSVVEDFLVNENITAYATADLTIFKAPTLEICPSGYHIKLF